MVKLSNFHCLDQDKFGEDNDCTLTSITAIIVWESQGKLSPQSVYQKVESIAKKYGYTGTKGTNPLVIRTIFSKSLRACGIDPSPKVRSKYLKGVCYDWQTVEDLIEQSIPVILSFWKAGKYKNHTVTVIGYDNATEELLIADNWSVLPQRLAYKDISFISSIVYNDF